MIWIFEASNEDAYLIWMNTLLKFKFALCRGTNHSRDFDHMFSKIKVASATVQVGHKPKLFFDCSVGSPWMSIFVQYL